MTYNSFGANLDSFYFVQFVKLNEYREVYQTFSKLTKGSKELQFNTDSDLEKFVLIFEKLINTLGILLEEVS